jgi:hypothetical protein
MLFQMSDCVRCQKWFQIAGIPYIIYIVYVYLYNVVSTTCTSPQQQAKNNYLYSTCYQYDLPAGYIGTYKSTDRYSIKSRYVIC